ncbi:MULTISPECIES: hypothetical protein [unclassified Sphingomonas]|uniref:hypothetical protein n=1 Tax=unclassified Sphingomonas TaxID=196159 RepID=UPI001D10C0F1|nr:MULTISPECIES: hypothetical protein [unclassified Sphingomonas]MCC2980819.1 hypothetical protein [Sphingomonas sp. IC4-52]MCD2317303.1 hypothetical protein [Sphingomonas sp. IC-11]
MANNPQTLGELNDLLAKLQALRATMVRDARDELAKTPAQAELINQYISDAETLLMDALKAVPGAPEDDGGLASLIGLGDRVASRLDEVRPAPLVPTYDDQISRDRLTAVADLYYIYQHERAGVFRGVLKLQQLFQSGEVRLSDGPGALSLYQFDRKRVLRYTQRERRSVYRKVFGYTESLPPSGAEPNTAFHALLSTFCQHVSRFFEDKRVSEVLRPDGGRETFGSMAVVRRSGLDLRHNLKQVSYGHVAVLRSEVMTLLQEAFDILGSNDVINLFGADNAWDALEEIMKRYLKEIPVTSQRSRMAVTGREILRWLAEDYLLNTVRIDFESLLEAIVDACDDWLTSAESLGLRNQPGPGRDNVVTFRPAARVSRGLSA